MTHNALREEAASLLSDVANRITSKFGIPAGSCEVVLFETLTLVMRQGAQLEFDEYLKVVLEEMPKGSEADFDRLREAREDFALTFHMVTSKGFQSSG